jgi:hypothetical protein
MSAAVQDAKFQVEKAGVPKLVLAGIGWVDLFWEELYPPQFKILGVLVLSLFKMVLTPIRPHSSIG